MDQIDKDCIEAKALGLSYGYYKALSYDPMQHTTIYCHSPQGQQQTRRFADAEAFALWQEGYSDGQIAAAIGVSKSRIQAWRIRMKLPPITAPGIDRKKYRLV